MHDRDAKEDEGSGSSLCPAFMIVGTGRCGSTLLQSMLMSHSEVRIGYETKFFFDFDPVAHGFNDPIGVDDVERYLDLIRDRNASGITRHDAELIDLYSVAVRDGMLDAGSMFRWILRAGVSSQVGGTIGEKTPGHWMKLDRVFKLGLECKVIHLIRDPRDVCESLVRMSWWPTDSYFHTAKHCAKTLGGCRYWDDKLGPELHLVVRFEDLITDTPAVLKGICAFLGLAFEEQMLSHESAAAHAFSAEREPHKEGSRKAVDPTRLEQYKTKLTRSQIRLVESVVGLSLLKRFGYPVESNWIDRVLGKSAEAGSVAMAMVTRQSKSIKRRLKRSRG